MRVASISIHFWIPNMYRFLSIGLFLFAGASLAQQPALRVIPDSPRANVRAYLEIDLPPCRVQATETTLQAPLVVAVRITTRTCLAGVIDVGKTIVPLAIFPSGNARLDITVDGGARSLSFAIGAAQSPNPDPGIATASMERVDRSLYAGFACGRNLGPVVNDARTEIVVDIVPPTEAIFCPAAAPIAVARIGFPRLGHHVMIMRNDGVITSTQWIIVEKGFDKLDYSDLWSVQGEDGWGMTIQQHDKDRLFAVVYGYRAGGQPLWMSLEGPDWETATRVRGAFIYSHGTPQNRPYVPPSAASGLTAYCQATLDFQSADTAILTMRCSGGSDIGLPFDRSWTLKRLSF